MTVAALPVRAGQNVGSGVADKVAVDVVVASCAWHGHANVARRALVFRRRREGEKPMAEEPIVLEIFTDYV
jgi:hypothetical protein